MASTPEIRALAAADGVLRAAVGAAFFSASNTTGPINPAGNRDLFSHLNGYIVLVIRLSGGSRLSPTNLLFQVFTTSILIVFSPSFKAFVTSTRNGGVHATPHEISLTKIYARLFTTPTFSHIVLFFCAER